MWTYESIKLNPNDNILEIGYGPGVTFKKVANKLTTGFIAGIDHSEVMFEHATKRNKKFIISKKAALECGTVWDLKYPENYFDTIFGSNVHFFWKNPVDEFKKLYSLLNPYGKLVMVFQPRWAKDEEEVIQIAKKAKKQYEEAGFTNIEFNFKKMKPVTCICIIGRK